MVTKNKRILFITQYFYPENFRGNDVAFALGEENNVHVVCGIPNYPHGKYYDGYGLIKRRREVIHNVKVTRLPIIPRGNGNSLLLMLNYFSFLFLGCLYVLYLAMFKKYDMVFVQQLSPVMMSMPGILYKRIRRVPLCTWVLDIWPESLQAAGNINNKRVLDFFARYAKKEYKHSDKLLVSSNSFVKSIMRYGDYAEKIEYFPQWSENETLHSIHIEEGKARVERDKFVVMFAGTIGEAQDFGNLMKVPLILRDYNIKWLLIGKGRKFEWLQGFIRDNNLEQNVYTPGYFSNQDMPGWYAQADVMLVSLKDEPIFSLTAPAKIQAYMAAGKPILAMINGEGGDIIRKAECGWVVPAGDFESLANVLKIISEYAPSELHKFGTNGLKYYEIHFKKERCLQRLKDIIKDEL